MALATRKVTELDWEAYVRPEEVGSHWDGFCWLLSLGLSLDFSLREAPKMKIKGEI